ncbi:hypothetical protein [Desulfosporosinus sp. FKA]|uniref:hypothetical protein n=1 Tax=Desulfosporosinus sp. FKA TaxID=1969834 RepID=UPI000B49907D|nr:hypothetical protein [Desulfosporosinus sp. FKA]
MAWVKTSDDLLCVKQMPELKSKGYEGEFDITKSEVVKWLIKQPGVLQYVYDVVRGKNHNREPLIVYNPERGTWRGINYGKN